MTDAPANRDDMVRSVIVWAIGLVAGIIVGVIVGRLFGLGAAPGLVFGAAVFMVLPYLIPDRRRAAAAASPAVHHAPVATPAAAPAPVAAAAAAPAPVAAAAPLAEPAPTVAAPVEVHEDAGPGAPASAISERVREAARAAGEAARAAVGDVPAGTKPSGLEAARGGAADDLKRIKGVGPKLEVLLHSLGIYHFDQIAAWGPDEVAWMDSNLEGFPGRVTRDGWVEQARVLAAGGETEHSRRVDRGEAH